MSNAIGVFDSGIGGLTVLSHLKSALPNEHFIYIGDNLHCPYGEKTKEQLFEYACNITNYFIKRRVKMIVLACNTVSANILDELKQKYPTMLFVGVIDATVEYTKQLSIHECLIIATSATIQSNKYQEMLKPHLNTVHAIATPKLVRFVEEGVSDNEIIPYLHLLLDDYKNVDAVILGCTHYPILSKQISDVLMNAQLISSSSAIVEVVVNEVEHLNTPCKSNGVIEIYTTGLIDEFYESSKLFFDYNDTKVLNIKV